MTPPRIALGGVVLLDMDVSGAGGDIDAGASAVDGGADVMAVEGALHCDRLGDLDSAGAGVGVEGKGSVADGEVNAAGAGVKLPVGGGLAGDLDAAGAGAGIETA